MRRFLNLAVAILICSATFFVFSCEDDISDVGSGMIDTGASANAFYADVIAYNTNNDSIRSDSKVLQSAVLGVYEEAVFGRTKARFISQARLSRMNPKFGTNGEMDSVILSIPVYFKSGEDDIEIDTTYLYVPDGQTPSDTATVMLKRTYKLDSIYGSTAAPMTIQVREVGEYLYSQDSIYYSNKNIANCQSCNNINNIDVLPNVLGSKSIGSKISTFQKKKLNSDVTEAPPVVVRIKLDKDYFKQKFIDNQNSPDLNDQASFIRNFFRGIELSVAEDQGFIMNFNPNSPYFSLVMYFNYDNPTPNPGDGSEYDPRLNSSLALAFASYWATTPGNNVHVNQFDHFNRSSQFVNAYTNPNTTQGDARLYLAGMDGTKTIIKINPDQLAEIKNNVNNNNWAIVGAELNFYVDDSYGLKVPPYLFAWNNYMKDDKVKNENFTDLVKYFNNYPSSVQFNPMYNYKDNPLMYTIRITDYIKSMVERDEVFEDGKIVLSLGNFLMSPTNGYASVMSTTNPFVNNRAFNPYRVVLHGNNTEQVDKKLRLKIYYTKK